MRFDKGEFSTYEQETGKVKHFVDLHYQTLNLNHICESIMEKSNIYYLMLFGRCLSMTINREKIIGIDTQYRLRITVNIYGIEYCIVSEHKQRV